MPTLQPSAEWVARRSPPSTRDSSASGCCPEHPATQAAADAESKAAEGSHELGMLHPHDDGVVGHRGSGGLIRGRAVFCLPPEVEWFQGHVAYTTVGGCSASLGVLGTELPVDPCMQCCHGGFSRHRLVFINHESGKESTLIVERYGGNMMSLHAEPTIVGAGDGPVPPESELSFQTHVMKADDDARALLDRYFQSIVRAASDPTELQDCIVCVGSMDVPLSLLQELAAPQPDSRTQSMVCSAFAPCRETSPPHNQQQQQQQPQSQSQSQPRPSRVGIAHVGTDGTTPVISPYPLPGGPVHQEQGQERKDTEEPPSPPPRAGVGVAQEGEDAAAAAAVAVPPRRPPPPSPSQDRTHTAASGSGSGRGGSAGRGKEGETRKEGVDRANRPEQDIGSSSSRSSGGGRSNDGGDGEALGTSEGSPGTKKKGDREEEEEDDDVWLER